MHTKSRTRSPTPASPRPLAAQRPEGKRECGISHARATGAVMASSGPGAAAFTSSTTCRAWHKNELRDDQRERFSNTTPGRDQPPASSRCLNQPPMAGDQCRKMTRPLPKANGINPITAIQLLHLSRCSAQHRRMRGFRLIKKRSGAARAGGNHSQLPTQRTGIGNGAAARTQGRRSKGNESAAVSSSRWNSKNLRS